MGKPIVVFFSRSGTTRGVAHDIAVAASAELEELLENKSRVGLLGYLRSSYESVRRKSAILRPLLHDIAESDLVIVGTPIWAAAPCTPIRTFLEENRDKIKNVAFFLTCGGTGSDKAIAEMEKIVGKSPRARLVLRARELRTDIGPLVETFVARAMQGMETKHNGAKPEDPLHRHA